MIKGIDDVEWCGKCGKKFYAQSKEEINTPICEDCRDFCVVCGKPATGINNVHKLACHYVCLKGKRN